MSVNLLDRDAASHLWSHFNGDDAHIPTLSEMNQLRVRKPDLYAALTATACTYLPPHEFIELSKVTDSLATRFEDANNTTEALGVLALAG